jgi:hypothetical protein
LRLCGLIAYIDMVQQRIILLSSCMIKRLFCLWGESCAYRLTKQNDLSAVNYHDLMMDNIDNKVTYKHLKTLKEIENIKFELLDLTTKR